MNWIRLLKNIPLRFNEERSEQLAQRHPDGYWRIYLSALEHVVCPDDALVVMIWRFHFFSRGGRGELKDFLQLARGCERLLDVGSSAGIFSALFANTRTGAEIISVEPDQRSLGLLRETMQRNSTTNPKWRIADSVVTDKPGKVAFSSPGFGGNIVSNGDGQEMEAHSLESLSYVFQFVPDIIKLDIESYEYEAVTGAINWLATHRPRLFLELHWTQLEKRGLVPSALLQSLAKVGYRHCGQTDFASFAEKSLDAAGVVRLALQCQN